MENNQNKKMEFEDIYSDSSNKPTYKKGHKPLSEREIYYPNKFAEFMLKNNKKNTKIILVFLIVFVVLLVALLGFVFANDFIDEKFGMMLTPEEGWSGDVNYTDPGPNDPDFEENEFEAMHEVSDAASLDDLLKKWYNLGGVMDQDYVTNVLLLGIDGKNGVKNGGNSDSMILVSINRKTKKITLVSFMRDSRTYYNINGRDYWAKMNSAFARGGADATVRTIENNYKIDIDYYVAVDFSSFSEVVDALGGVTVDVQEYEQKYINRTTNKIKKIPNYGKVKLNGDQALVYCRIRKCDADSDVSRTRRQRGFISALITSAKGASLNQLNNAINTVLPHVLTNCTKDAILSFAGQALTQGWMNYEIVQLTMPDPDTRKSTYFDGISYWVVDYALAARKVQQAVYGTTNITIDGNRESALDYVQSIPKPDKKPESTTAPDISEEYTNAIEETTTGDSVSDYTGETETGSDYTGESESDYTGESETDYTGEFEETTTRKPLFEGWRPGRDEETTTAPPAEDTTPFFENLDQGANAEPAA